MFNLRPYQRAAVDALFAYFENNTGNPIIALPTGSGKSVVQAMFIEEVLARWPNERLLLLTHVKELIEQNVSQLAGLDVGVYSAGLNRRELGHQVTVGGIQSLYKRWYEVGDVGIVIIDECHLVTKTSNTMYQKFLASLRVLSPHIKVIGLSATPFRLDSGPLIKGENHIFTDIVYTANIKDLIRDGYLTPIVSASVTKEARVDASEVKKRGGEYVTGDLERVMLEKGNTEAALDEVERLAGDRKGWLVFCVGVEHAREVTAALIARGHGAAVVVGRTPKRERATIIAAFKAGELRALVSVGVLTTGFDAPSIDALVCLRPTLSPGLWVQMAGRGTRTAPGKTDCMILDFTDNTHIHGPVDLIDFDNDGNLKTSPYRTCPACGEPNEPRAKKCEYCDKTFQKTCLACRALVDINKRVCPDCGTWFGQAREATHRSQASTGEVISSDMPFTYTVEDWVFRAHRKNGKPSSLRVEYRTDTATYREWVCLEHTGYASEKAAMWWVRHGGKAPTPKTIGDAMRRMGELERPDKITVKRNGKYWNVC